MAKRKYDELELSLDLKLDLDLDLGEVSGEPNPLENIDYEGTIEKDTPKEISALLKAYKDRVKGEAARFKNATDSEYWFAVCFQNREQKERFLQAMDWIQHGDKYLDGGKIAKQSGIDLPVADVRYIGEKPDKKMSEFPTI